MMMPDTPQTLGQRVAAALNAIGTMLEGHCPEFERAPIIAVNHRLARLLVDDPDTLGEVVDALEDLTAAVESTYAHGQCVQRDIGALPPRLKVEFDDSRAALAKLEKA